MRAVIRETEIDGRHAFAIRTKDGCSECSLKSHAQNGCRFADIGTVNSCRNWNPENQGQEVIYVFREEFLLKRLKGEL